MTLHSIALTFKLGLSFHALNNEGGGGTNVMEPRRITVGAVEYDALSGEIVRRHILENFVRLCADNDVPLSAAGRGLRPDRGKEDLTAWMKREKLKGNKLTPEYYPEATRHLVKTCAVRDVGGYLMALERADQASGTLKRDSVFEVGWLVSTHPVTVGYTQHSAYYPDQQHNLFTQNVRSGVYAGVLRLDARRVGHNDWAWLDGSEENCITAQEKQQRLRLLLEAIAQYLLSPGGAKQAGWLQHTGLLEGAIVTSNWGPAPFVSPLEVSTQKVEEGGVTAVLAGNAAYRQQLSDLVSVSSDKYRMIEFNNQAELLSAVTTVLNSLEVD